MPDKLLTRLIVTPPPHCNHSKGPRTEASHGLTTISRRNNEVIFHEVKSRATPNLPDAPGRNPEPMQFVPPGDTPGLQTAPAITLSIA